MRRDSKMCVSNLPVINLVDADGSSYIFGYVCNINVITFYNFPQPRYANKKKLTFHEYGYGPFCKFKLIGITNACGVYVITLNRDNRYIGECVKLSNRYNNGYGNISPRNCYTNGQQTNCRINNLIHDHILIGDVVEVWFHQTQNHKHVEKTLKDHNAFPWNR